MAISQNTAGQLGSHRRNRNCLPEIATSACGLLAMTIPGAGAVGEGIRKLVTAHGAQGVPLQTPARRGCRRAGNCF